MLSFAPRHTVRQLECRLHLLLRGNLAILPDPLVWILGRGQLAGQVSSMLDLVDEHPKLTEDRCCRNGRCPSPSRGSHRRDLQPPALGRRVVIDTEELFTSLEIVARSQLETPFRSRPP
jgi:hypothetical protein